MQEMEIDHETAGGIERILSPANGHRIEADRQSNASTTTRRKRNALSKWRTEAMSSCGSTPAAIAKFDSKF